MHWCLMSWLDLIFDILQNASHYCPGFEKATFVFQCRRLCVMFAEFRLGEKQKVCLLAITADL